MSDNDYLKKLIKSKKKKSKSPLEKFINKEDVTVENEPPAVNKPSVEIEHYGGTTQTPKTDTDKQTEPQQVTTNPTEPSTSKSAPDSLLKASGLREFDIDSLDIDSSEEVSNKATTQTVSNEIPNQNRVSVTDDEINQLIEFVKAGNFDAAVDFIVQLKLKYNIDNII